MRILILLLLCVNAFAAMPSIEFGSGSWVLDNGVTYDEFSGELTIEGNASEYRRAVLTVNIPAGVTDLYFVTDQFYQNIQSGPNAWDRPKFKIYDSFGTKLTACNIDDPSEDIWTTDYCFVTLSGQTTIQLEVSMQNTTGTFKTKLPYLSETVPVVTPYSFPYAVPADPNVYLSIQSSEKQMFENDLLSSNCHFSWASYSWSDGVVIDQMNNFYPMTNLRFPGGTVGNFYNYLTDGYHGDAATFDSPSRQNAYNNGFTFDYNGYKAQAIASGASSTLMFNMIHDDVPTSAARFQSRLNDGLNVKWIELGNENYFTSQAYGNIADGWQTPSITNYINHTQAVTTALKAIDPNVQVAVNINHLSYEVGDWTELLSQETYYDAVVMHSYLDVWNTNLIYSSGAKLIGAYRTVHDNLDEYKQMFGTTPLIITEWGIQDAPESFLSVLAIADMFMALEESNHQDGIVQQAGIHMFYHSDANRVAQLTYWDGSKMVHTATGSLYAKLFNTFKNNAVYNALSSSDSLDENLPCVIARAAEDGDSIRVMVINKLPVASEFHGEFDGQSLSGSYRMEVLSEAIESPWPSPLQDPLSAWVNNTGNGMPSIPAYSIAVLSFEKPIITGEQEMEVIQVDPYPNPASSMIYWDVTCDFKLFDGTGKLVLQGNNNAFSCESFQGGLYFLEIQNKMHKIVLK